MSAACGGGFRLGGGAGGLKRGGGGLEKGSRDRDHDFHWHQGRRKGHLAGIVLVSLNMHPDAAL